MMATRSQQFAGVAIPAILFCTFSNLVAQEDDFPRRDAVEVTIREGLPNIVSKLETDSDQELRIGYLGGSITAAQSGWRSKSLDWLRKRFPDRKIEEVNAAIGGTGSDLGVFRLGQDVLQHKPDLLFVEFAVNDGGAAPERIQRAMEGIVRQTWEADPTTDIVFVYTLSEPFLAELQDGKFSRSASAMEGVADHYGIPTIHLGLVAASREKDGTLIFKGEAPKGEPDPDKPMVFSKDGVHPLASTGHQLYLEAIVRSWEKIENATDKTISPHELSKPLRPDHWAAAKLVPISEEMLSGDWEKLDNGEKGNLVAKKFAGKMPEMWRANSAGAALSFRFRGSQIALYDIVGPDGGVISLTVDDESARDVRRIDGYCTYHRLSKISVATDLDPETVHSLQMVLSDEELDKREILFKKNREFFDNHPDNYEAEVWHVGSVMIIGDIVE